MPSAHRADPDAKSRAHNAHVPELGAAAVLVDVSRISRNPLNPRDEFEDNDPDLLVLVESLKQGCLINAVHVEPTDLERFTLIAGERRWRAAALAGWKTIPAYLCRGMSQAAKICLMVSENLARKNLNAIEESRAIQQLVTSVADGGAGFTREKAAELVGKHPDVVRRTLNLLRLPPSWQKRIASGDLRREDGIRLAVYSERPDVLAAVELDMEKNSEDWSSGEPFFRQLRFVAERLDALPRSNGAKPPAAGTPNVPALQRDMKSGNAFVEHDGERLVMGRYNTKLSRQNYDAFLERIAAEPSAARPELRRRSAPVDHEVGTGAGLQERDDELKPGTLDAVLASVFDVLDKLKPRELLVVQAYLSKRAAGIEGPEARAAR